MDAQETWGSSRLDREPGTIISWLQRSGIYIFLISFACVYYLSNAPLMLCLLYTSHRDQFDAAHRGHADQPGQRQRHRQCGEFLANRLLRADRKGQPIARIDGGPPDVYKRQS